MKTVRQIFEISMAIADSLNGSGQAVTGDNLEYQQRTPGIINILQSELVMKVNYLMLFLLIIHEVESG